MREKMKEESKKGFMQKMEEALAPWGIVTQEKYGEAVGSI